MKLNPEFLFKKNKRLVDLIILSMVILFFTAPILKHPLNTSLNSDWNQIYSYLRFDCDTIKGQYQFPLRCPYFGGGYPLMANPQDMSLSPLFIPILLFGEVLGTKLLCVFSYFLCAFGMYYLTRYILNFNRLGALFSSLSLTLSSWLPNQLADGNFTKIYYYFVPLMLFLLLKIKTGKKFLFYSAFLLTIVLFQAGISFLAICLFLTIFIIFIDRGETGILNLKYLFLVFFLTFLLGALKIIPMLEILFRNSRKIDYNFLINHSLNIKTFILSLFKSKYSAHSTIYIGYIAVFLSLSAFIFDFKKQKRILLILLIVLTISFGPNSLVNLSKIIWEFPGFQSLGKLDKYYSFFIALLLCLTAGAFITLIQKKLPQWLTLAFFLLLVFNTADIFINNIYFLNNIFDLEPAHLNRQKGGFYQIKTIGNNLKINYTRDDEERDKFAYLQYILLKENIGVINWYGNIYLNESAIPKYFIKIISEEQPFIDKEILNPEYSGELFFVNNKYNLAIYDKFSPNVIKIRLNLNTPDVLVINQNFDRSWKSNQGELFSWNGLLAIKIKNHGESVLKLTYLPLSFFIGLIISIAAIVFSILILRKRIFV